MANGNPGDHPISDVATHNLPVYGEPTDGLRPPVDSAEAAIKVCAFCGEPGSSREHIISTAVQKRMQLSGVEIEIGVREEEGNGKFRQAHGLNEFVTRKVCAACNSGWMSQLEVDFLGAAGPLIEPEWPRLESEFLSEAVKKSEILARWAVKTAITANLAGILKRSIPDEIARGVREGKLPRTLTVKFAHIRRREAIGMVINRGFWFEDGKERRWLGAASGRSFDVLFQLNHLAIRAINAPGAELGFADPEKGFPLTAFPSAKNPRFGGYSFETLADFEQIMVARIPQKPT